MTSRSRDFCLSQAKRAGAFRVLALGVFLLWSSPLTAQTFWVGAVPPSKEIRSAQAREWLRDFKELDTQLPTLSPREAAWLKTEYDDQIASAGGKLTSRAIAAMGSLEFQKRRARRGLDELLRDLNLLSDSFGGPIEREITAWLRVASDMMDQSFWQSIDELREKKVIPNKVNGLQDLLFENHVMWARQIIERVVVPLLQQSDKGR